MLPVSIERENTDVSAAYPVFGKCSITREELETGKGWGGVGWGGVGVITSNLSLIFFPSSITTDFFLMFWRSRKQRIRHFVWWHPILKLIEDVPLVKFKYLVFIRMPGESYCRQLRSLLLRLCDVFWALINCVLILNSLVCWFWSWNVFRVVH